ncbi:hypothetical protein QBC45DRAFT_405411 [Copromyces sp. CBS 386.78]|nr:hypothetical protein QBC45DRAFT_405411 [Copromyces sp. CBS 386.78]
MGHSNSKSDTEDSTRKRSSKHKPRFARKKDANEYKFIKLGLKCMKCQSGPPCIWTQTFAYHWTSIDEQYLKDKPDIDQLIQMHADQPAIDGRFELQGDFCWIVRGNGYDTMEAFRKGADIGVGSRPTAKTRVKRLRTLMDDLDKHEVKVKFDVAPPIQL